MKNAQILLFTLFLSCSIFGQEPGIDITHTTRQLETGWNETDVNWLGHSLIFGTKAGRYAHNVVEIRPGGASNGELHSALNLHHANSVDDKELRIKLHTSTNAPTYFNAGNVGIGTTTPKNKLSVNGTIWAKEVKVTLTDAADWVFEEDYQLRSLSEVESFIQKNKQLPEIPSAEEFRQNDLKVSEMANKLLQKIEELTLYTIEQEKKIEKQNEKLEKMKILEERLKKLEITVIEK